MLYASQDGSDVAACDFQHPCSIAHAFAIADSAHQTIKAMPGTYSANLVVAAKTIVLDGYGATLIGPGAKLAVQINDGGHFTGRGFTATSSASVPVACYSTSSISSARYIELDDVILDGLTPFGANDCTVVVRGSKLTSHSASKAEPGLTLTGSNATIDRTIFDGEGGSGLVATTASSFTVTNSVFANQTGGAVSLDANSHGAISFSTFYRSHLTCATGSLVVDSSIFSNGAQGGSGSPDSVDDSVTCSFKYSLFVPQQAVPSGTKNVGNMDPLLTDPSHGSFAPQAGSPVIDTGDPTNPPPIDLLGTSRPQGAAPDIGAVERKP